MALNRQVAEKCEVLSVESRCHQPHDYARRAYERHYLYAVALCEGHDVGSGVGHSRASGLGYHAAVSAVEDGAQHGVDLLAAGVFAQLDHGEAVDIDALVARLEEAARRAQILDNEVAQRLHYAGVVAGKHAVGRGF